MFLPPDAAKPMIISDALFRIVNFSVLPAWALLAVAPQGRLTRWLVHSGMLSMILSAGYLVIALLYFGRSPGGFGTLSGVAQLFSNPYLLLAGWIHYLAFDLWIGSWMVREAERAGFRRLYVVPCLAMTLFFGPVGFLLFQILRLKKIRKRSVL